MVIYNSEDITSTIKQFDAWYQTISEEGLPSALSIQRGVLNSAGRPMLAAFVLWSSSDLEEGNSWVQKICSAAPVAMNTVTKTTIPDWMASVGKMLNSRTHGTISSVSFRAITPEVLEVLCKYAEKIASEPNTSFWVHELRKGPSTLSYPDSVFPTREPHFVLEILSTSETAEGLENSAKLAKEFQEELQGTNSENILPPYLPFTSPKALDLRKGFGGQYEALEAIKKEYDPLDVYRYACARF